MLPTFLVIGARKAGTTSLHRYLAGHPDVFMPAAKRLDYFSGANFDRGPTWYADQFRGGRDARARGEASNSYTRYPVAPETPERIAALVPDVRLVYLVRHPIERMESYHRQAVAEWDEPLPIDEAVFAHWVDYVSTSSYGAQIDRYLGHFAPDQLLVVTSEDLRDRRHDMLSRVFEFVGVDPARAGDVARDYNRSVDQRRARAGVVALRRSGVYRRARAAVPAAVRLGAWRALSRPVRRDPLAHRLSPDVRDAIVEKLQPDLARLREHLGATFHCWGLLDRDA